MTQKIKISIVTVCYNSAATIEQTIQSVLGQSYPNIEYIIIDGGSTDGTVDIIKKYASQLAYWVSESDKGIYDAMNKGIKQATGKLIGFMNSDDWYAEGAIEVVADKYKETQADVIYGDVTLVDAMRQSYKLVKRECIKDFYSSMQVAHPGTFVRGRLQKKYLFDTNYRIAADYKFLLYLWHSGYKFAYLDYNVAFFSMEGISANKLLTTARETKRVSLEILGKNKELYQRYIKEVESEYNKSKVRALHHFLFKRAKNFPNKIKDELVDCRFFGAGEIGVNSDRLLRNLGVKPNCFLDNDDKKQGMKLCGLPVRSPQSLLKNDSGWILFTTDKYEDEIEIQLNGMGFKHGINYWRYEDWVQQLARWYTEGKGLFQGKYLPIHE